METAWYTEIDVVTATAPAAYVYVDQNGNPVAAPAATSSAADVVQHGNWNGQEQGDHGHQHSAAAQTTTVAPVVVPAPATTSAAAVVVPVVSIPVVSVPVVSVAPVSIAPVVVPVASSQAAPVASSAPVTGGDGLGVTYTPYTTGPCKDASQVAKDIAGLSKYKFIRLYGTDCNQIANVMDAMTSTQMVMLSVFDIDSRLDAEVQSLKDQVGTRWAKVSAISIGNERLSNGNDAATVIAAVQQARSQLSSSFSGPIGTVDTVANYKANNGALCATADQDTIFVNCHPFFGQTSPANAGNFVQENVADLQKTCNVKNVVITETGWPSGTSLPALFTGSFPVMPNVADQSQAISSITKQFSSNLFLFSAYNEAWKPINAATFGVEQSWGFLGNAPSS